MSAARIQSHEARASLLGGQSSDWAYQPHSGARHHRKGYPVASAGGRQAQRTMYRPNTLWTWALVVVTAVQAAIVLVFESYVFAKFQASLKDGAESDSYSRAIPTSLTLYIFGFLYQLVLVYDALRLQNTIQVIGLCTFNVALLVYASVQMTQIHDAIDRLDNKSKIKDPVSVWDGTKPYLTAVPCIIALGFVLMSVVAWKLYDEFAWMIYKHISADLKMKRRYLTYQIYIALLKFDFFFFLGFTIQFVVVVVDKSNVEFYLTIAAIPVTILILFMAAVFTQRENRPGMVVIILLYIAGLAYFLFKLVRMWHSSPERMEQYKVVRKSMTAFAAITIILILITVINACICTANFGKGLKPHLAARKLDSEDEKTNITEMPNLSHGGPVPSRMTID
ncbi:hypothetical protein MMC07_007099 [Pseudocyphellaria aurata]|nr:hypothetical protein [Pseudocyphellaria aurata]